MLADVGRPYPAAATELDYSFGATRGFNVSAGAFTANLVCNLFTGAITLGNSSIMAIFVP